MFLVKLHDMIKQNYEQGLYSQNYTYKGYTNKSNLTSDFIMGKNKARSDYQHEKRFKHYPKLLFKLINFVSGRKISEIVEFINGYNYEKQSYQKSANEKG